MDTSCLRLSEIQFTILQRLRHNRMRFDTLMGYKLQSIWSLFYRGWIRYDHGTDTVTTTLAGQEALTKFGTSQRAKVLAATTKKKGRGARLAYQLSRRRAA